MLPEIILSCDTPGIIYIGNSYLGEIGEDSYQSFIGAGTFCLRYIPFSSGKIHADLCIKISVLSGTPVFDCPYMHMFNCKDNVFLLELLPPPLAGHTLPVCHSYTATDDRFIVSLIEQNCFYLVIEDEKRELADSFFPLSFDTVPTMHTLTVNNSPVIMLSDGKSRVYAFCRNNKEFKKALILDADSWDYADGYIIITKTTSAKHKITNAYTAENGKMSLAKTTFNINSLPADDAIVDFLECVKYGIESRALSYLAADLTLSFDELREFLGTYSRFKKSPFDENAYALIFEEETGGCLVSRFAFELSKGKIYNIQEL